MIKLYGLEISNYHAVVKAFMLEKGFESFYKVKDGATYYYSIPDKDYVKKPGQDSIIILDNIRESKEIWSNSGVSIQDLGDGIINCEFRSKMNSIGGDVLAGINKAISTLHGLENDPSNITVKWDGSPAVIFGRDEEGNFILTDKSGFGAKGYNGRAKSADELETMLKNRPGYANNPDGYGPFIEKMKTVYGTFEAATPESFEGYVLGDLLYFSTPSVVEGAYEFTPNIVTYRVKTDSDIGSQIAASDAGVVLHAHMDFEGNKSKVDVSKLNAGKLLIMPPVTVTQAPKVEADNLNKLEAFAKSNASKIDTLLDDSYLKANKLSGFKNALYSYVNNMTKARKLDNLDKDYAGWLDTAKLSAPMKERMLAHVEANMEGMQALFKIITGIMSVKNDIIAQLDASDADVEAYTDGQRGGEGYVIGQGDSKLVNRSGFSAANMGRER